MITVHRKMAFPAKNHTVTISASISGDAKYTMSIHQTLAISDAYGHCMCLQEKVT